jgi:hypothetical protein
MTVEYKCDSQISHGCTKTIDYSTPIEHDWYMENDYITLTYYPEGVINSTKGEPDSHTCKWCAICGGEMRRNFLDPLEARLET